MIIISNYKSMETNYHNHLKIYMRWSGSIYVWQLMIVIMIRTAINIKLTRVNNKLTRVNNKLTRVNIKLTRVSIKLTRVNNKNRRF